MGILPLHFFWLAIKTFFVIDFNSAQSSSRTGQSPALRVPTLGASAPRYLQPLRWLGCSCQCTTVATLECCPCFFHLRSHFVLLNRLLQQPPIPLLPKGRPSTPSTTPPLPPLMCEKRNNRNARMGLRSFSFHTHHSPDAHI